MPDYTKQRKSKLIRICPKCGLKGKYRHNWSIHKGIRTDWDIYFHVSRLEMGFEAIEQYCTVNFTKTEVK